MAQERGDDKLNLKQTLSKSPETVQNPKERSYCISVKLGVLLRLVFIKLNSALALDFREIFFGERELLKLANFY